MKEVSKQTKDKRNLKTKFLAAFFSLTLLLKFTAFDYEENFEKDSSY